MGTNARIRYGASLLLPVGALSLLFQIGCDRPSSGHIDFRTAEKQSLQPTAPAVLAAGKLGVAPDAVVLGPQHTLSFPLTGKGTITRQKAYANLQGQPVGVDLSMDAGGNEVDADSLITAENQAWQAKYGKKSVRLFERMQSLGKNEKIPVSFWLHIPEADIPLLEMPPAGDGASPSAMPNAKDAESRRTSYLAGYSKSTAKVKGRFLPKLRKLDPTASDLGSEPYFIANLSADAASALEKDLDVDSVDVGDSQPQAQLDHAKTALDYARIHLLLRGFPPLPIIGLGVKIGQVENSAPLPSANLIPQIGAFTEPNPGSGCSDDGNHMERVASVMKSNDNTYQGVAPGAPLYVAGKCNSTTSSLESEATNAKNWGALALNNSWGLDTTAVGARPSNDDKFFDSLVFNNRMTVVHAAGNSTDQLPDCRVQGTKVASTGMVMSPGLGYNVITVGGASEMLSGVYPDIWPCSAWKNPGSTNGDRNKPEVVAPSDILNTLTTCDQSTYFSDLSCQGYYVSGTSLAAPFITGTAALLLQVSPVLSSWPEAIKAVIMAASAPLPSSDRDHYGAGLINIGRAVDIVRGVNGNWRANSAPTCSGTWPFTWPAYLAGGKQARVAITWSQNPNYDKYSNQPQADLDLEIYDPNGAFVGRMNSYDNNYEYMDFVPAQTGTYSIHFLKWRCDYTFANNRLGIAWYQAP